MNLGNSLYYFKKNEQPNFKDRWWINWSAFQNIFEGQSSQVPPISRDSVTCIFSNRVYRSWFFYSIHASLDLLYLLSHWAYSSITIIMDCNFHFSVLDRIPNCLRAASNVCARRKKNVLRSWHEYHFGNSYARVSHYYFLVTLYCKFCAQPIYTSLY